MSWDVLLYSAEGTPQQLAALEDAVNSLESGLPLIGEASTIRSAISECVPQVDWSDPTWGILDGDGFSIEFNMGSEQEIRDIMLHVRGSGDPIPAIVAVSRCLNCNALDTVTSDCLALQEPSSEGWREFQKYRDQVMNERSPK